MRYWPPFPKRTIADLLDQGAEQFLVVPAYPHYAGATTGSTLQFVREGIESLAPAATVREVIDWHMLPGYLEALAEPVTAAITDWITEQHDPRECALLYVAHSLPEKFIEQGDPYLDLVSASVEEAHRMVTAAVTERVDTDLAANRSSLAVPGFMANLASQNDGSEPRLVFQSKVGPIKWLGPEITAEVDRLAAKGCRRLFVQPVSFTCEHIETLHELDIQLKEHVSDLGFEDFARGPALNLHSGWLDSMASELIATAFEPKVSAHV